MNTDTPTGHQRESWSGKIHHEVSVECGLCSATFFSGPRHVAARLKAEGWAYTRRWGWLCSDHAEWKNKKWPPGHTEEGL